MNRLSSQRVLAPDAATCFAELDGKLFSASEIASARIVSQDDINNFVHKNRLLLCSKTSGAGKQRKFCLVDAYILALTRRIVDITKRAEWAARAIEFLFYDESLKLLLEKPLMIGEALRPKSVAEALADDQIADAVRIFREACCSTASNAHPMFSEREGTNSWVLFIDPDEVKYKNHTIEAIRSANFDNISAWSGIFIRPHEIFKFVDRSLWRQLHAGPGRDGTEEV